ncbi:tetratricopeptide repeat protein [Lactobacillus corticis]|uniref:Peptide-binding protein n=1 Tax=Lactobacillus corticis TaxID=2201249 RepID=A0A916QJM6_9LACO|nr:tetratricopeptide repeat protein [Lactobacillus corticis]GFZ26982.1 peptide-binding protein [Lactobacillus corticis]
MTYSEQLLDAIESHDFSNNQHLLNEAIDHDSPEVLASLAENLTAYGFSDLAKTVYRSLIAKVPGEDLFKVYLAEILLNDGSEDDALTLLYGVPKDSDAYLDSLLVLADYYQTNGLIEPARQKLLQARALAPEEDAITFGLAELDYLSGNFGEALDLYQDLVKRQDYFGEVDLNNRIFETQAKLGNYEEAAELAKKHENSIIDIDSKYKAGLVFLQTGEIDLAIKYLDQVIDQSPDYVNAYPLLAEAYLKKHDDDQVLRSAQAGLAYNQLDETLYSMGAQAAIRLGQNETAEDLLQRGLKVNPDNSDLLLQLANLLVAEQKNDELLDLFKDRPDSQIEPDEHWDLAIAYQRLDRLEEAKAEYLAAYPNLADNSNFLRNMIGLFLNLPKSTDIVKQLLERYLKQVPDDEEMQQLYLDLTAR